MNFLLLPDFFAMSFMVLVLTLVRRRYQKYSMRMWTTGLLLILLECAARILYSVAMAPAWHRVMHVVALDAYFLAGAFFLRSAAEDIKQMAFGGMYLAVNALPHLLLLSIYGFEIRAGVLYRVIAVLGCALGFLSAALLHRPRRHYFAFAFIWTPLIIAASADSFRVAIYISLFSLYMLVAVAFATTLPKGSRGKLTVVTGFVIWSLCFLSHPWIAQSHPAWADMAGEIWNMQKFLIALGFLLVLFEKQLESNEWLALHDQLTGLPNRRLFDDRITNAFARAERDRSALLLFNLDLDGFKEVNDTLGHEVGDALLKRVSANLQNAVRKTDTLARLGGDEFSLLAIDVRSAEQQANRKWTGPVTERQEMEPFDSDVECGGLGLDQLYAVEVQPILRQAEKICAMLKRAVAQPVELRTGEGQVTVRVAVSIGVSLYPQDGADAATLARVADRRMYEDKRMNRGRKKAMDERVMTLVTT